jgi:hypothetical protein
MKGKTKMGKSPKKPVVSPKKNTGYVAFFDILGYLKLMGNIGEVTTDVLKTMIDVPEKSKRYALKAYSNNNFVSAVIEEIKILNVSDSIFVWLNIEDIKHKDLKKIQGFEFHVFLVYCSVLFESFFDKGLPLRGVINYGEFFTHQHSSGNSFAGKPIVECYELEKKLEISGCVLAREMREYIKDNSIVRDACREHIDNEIFDYPVPIKGDKTENLQVLYHKRLRSMINSDENLEEDNKKDVRKDFSNPEYMAFKGRKNLRPYIVDKFMSYGKFIEPIVLPKVNNTEMLFSKMLIDLDETCDHW